MGFFTIKMFDLCLTSRKSVKNIGVKHFSISNKWIAYEENDQKNLTYFLSKRRIDQKLNVLKKV
jgi:hypothetical protein